MQSTECKRVTRDVRAAYDRVRKLYTKYVALHKRAAEACANAGLPPPELWVPPSLTPSSTSTAVPASPVPTLAPPPARAASLSSSPAPVTAASPSPSPPPAEETVIEAEPSRPWSLELQPAQQPDAALLAVATASVDSFVAGTAASSHQHHRHNEGDVAAAAAPASLTWETASEGGSLGGGGGGGSVSLSGASNSSRFRLSGSGGGLSLASVVGLPSTMGAANVTTAQRIASMQGAAANVAAAAEAARLEAVAAWEAYSACRGVFATTAAGTVSAFREIDRRRAAEMCDSVRKFTIFQASCLANLQYDVQRLAPKVEAASEHAVNAATEPPAEAVIEEALGKVQPLAGLLAAAAAGGSSGGWDGAGGASPALSSAATPTDGAHFDAFAPGAATSSSSARRGSVDRQPAPPPAHAEAGAASSSLSEGIAGLAQRSIGRRSSLTGFLSEALSVPHAGAHHPPLPHPSSPLVPRSNGFSSSRPSSVGEHSSGGAAGLKSLFNKLSNGVAGGAAGGVNLLRRGSRDAGGSEGPGGQPSPHRLSLTAGGTLLPPSYSDAAVTPPPGARRGSVGRGTPGGSDSPSSASASLRGPVVNAGALKLLDFLVDACFDPAGDAVTPAVLAAGGYGGAGGDSSSASASPALSTPARAARATADADEGADLVIPAMSLSAFAGLSGSPPPSSSDVPSTPPPAAASPAPLSTPPSTPLPDLGVALNPVVLYLLPRAQAALYAEPNALSHLVHSLDLRRGGGASGRLTKPSLDALGVVVSTALDVARATGEHTLVRAIMVLSQAYYCLAESSSSEEEEEVDLLVAAAALGPGEARAAGEADAAAFAASKGTGSAPGTPRASPVASRPAVTPVRRASHTTDSFTTPPPLPAAGSSSSPSPSPTRHAKKVYLQTRIRYHPVWQDEAFWEFAVYDTVGQEISKLAAAPSPSGGGPSSGAAAAAEAVRSERERDVTYGQLGFFAYTMVSFAVPKERVALLLEKYAKLVRLSEGQWGMLLASLAAFEAPPPPPLQAGAGARA